MMAGPRIFTMCTEHWSRRAKAGRIIHKYKDVPQKPFFFPLRTIPIGRFHQSHYPEGLWARGEKGVNANLH